jgi:hypothetical protein
MSVRLFIDSATAADARQEMMTLLGLSWEKPACEPVVEDVPACEPVVETDVPTEPVVEEKKKGTRGRPKKTEVVATPEATPEATSDVVPSNVDAAGVEYEDVDEPVKRTAAELRDACIKAVDRTSYEMVQKFLKDNYGTAVAAEVPADKITEAFDKVSKLAI